MVYIMNEHTEKAKLWRINNRKQWNDFQRKYSKRRRDKIRTEILQLLGNKCIRCGFSDPRALQIDHVHGYGHREKSSHGSELYYKLILRAIKNGSDDYQCLCANCNWIKRTENHECDGCSHPSP